MEVGLNFAWPQQEKYKNVNITNFLRYEIFSASEEISLFSKLDGLTVKWCIYLFKCLFAGSLTWRNGKSSNFTEFHNMTIQTHEAFPCKMD